jgi:hypothetical protein
MRDWSNGVIQVDTTGLDISNNEEVMYRRLFEALLQCAKGPDPLRGNVQISWDGAGHYLPVKIERFLDLNRSPQKNP